jgi:hypothetical protein
MSNLEISDWNKIVFNNVNTQHKFKLVIIDKKDTEQEFIFTNLETINVNNIKEVISAKVGYGKAWKNVISIVNKLLQSNTVNADNADNAVNTDDAVNTDEPSNTVDAVNTDEPSNTVDAVNTDEPSNTVDAVVPSNMTYIKNSKLFKLEFIKHPDKYHKYTKYPNYYFS